MDGYNLRLSGEGSINENDGAYTRMCEPVRATNDLSGLTAILRVSPYSAFSSSNDLRAASGIMSRGYGVASSLSFFFLDLFGLLS